MTSKELILSLQKDRSQKTICFSYFQKNENRIQELVAFACTNNDYPLQEYASWILIHVTKAKTKHVSKHQPQIIDAFLLSTNQTVLRNLCNCLFQLPYNNYKETELLDQLISHIRNMDNKVALHVYSIYKLIQFVQKYPELNSEIQPILDPLREQIPLPPSLKVALRNYEKGISKK